MEVSVLLPLATFYDVWLPNVCTQFGYFQKKALSSSWFRLVFVCLVEQKQSFTPREEVSELPIRHVTVKLDLVEITVCAGNPLLAKFEETLRDGLSTIMNVLLTDDQCIRVSLPVQNGGLGPRGACMLAPPAFSSLVAATPKLQKEILLSQFRQLSDPYGRDLCERDALDIW